MTDIRRTLGVSLLSSLLIIVLSGFLAHSSRDLVLVLIGFVLGLLAVYTLDALKRRDARRSRPTSG